MIDPGTMPHRPGISASGTSIGATIMSQVLVPMIFTKVPGLILAPTAPDLDDRSGNDAAQARDIRKRNVHRGDHHVAGAGADDLHQSSRLDTRSNGSRSG